MALLINQVRYAEIKSLVADLIEDYGLTYPIDPFNLGELLGAEIVVHKRKLPSIAAHLQTSDGFTESIRTEFGVTFRVHVNGEMPEARQRFTLAHECAHIWLDHLVDGNFVDFDRGEQEANFFASYLLAPDVLVDSWLARVQVPEISSEFNVSHEAATFVFKRYMKAAALGPLESEVDLRILRSATRRNEGEMKAQILRVEA
ncbi:unannotated protein [freshwater metagenome]|jgi:hypothetical protein|uniref:Unannotated protein n=1 Tax=freshwater metagenome TaxID=449393 RepID=A0A6J6DXA8_9ZZZZ|nr:ImmA/IrrE family metallo-endopeptidase [Actinomycetota bacterium]